MTLQNTFMWFQCQKFITNIFRKVSFPCLFPLPYIMLNCAKLPKINYFISKNAISVVVAATAKSLQSCPTLCDPIDGSPRRLLHHWDSPGKNTGVGCHFLLQCMKVKVKVKSLSHVQLSATPWTAAYQAPPSMGFSRQEYWSRVPLPSPKFFY